MRSRYDFFDHPHGDGAFKLYPLVYKRLVAEEVDEPLLPRMKGIYRYWWSSNQRLFAMAAKLLEEIRSQGTALHACPVCAEFFGVKGDARIDGVDEKGGDWLMEKATSHNMAWF